MTNPFDDPDGTFHVLVNEEGQHSLWPSYVDIPDGWSAVLRDRTHQECLEHVEEHWSDMRPRSLVVAVEASAAPDGAP